MQVLGGLVLLPEGTSSLPLPWWHRAPLGFSHNTKVYVGLVTSTRPVGDIVVGVLDINKWQNIIRVDVLHKDEQGVIAKLLEPLRDLNIALAETVTMETGHDHRATLFCEALGSAKVAGLVPTIRHSLESNQFQKIDITPYVSRERLDPWQSIDTRIHHGWLRDIPFLDWIRDSCSDEARSRIDLTQAVVSADTETRIMRFVFPFKGARTVKVWHADQPGALLCCFQAIQECGLNVLSAVLRRGGQGDDRAELVAVCEHKGSEEEAKAAFEMLPAAIRKQDQKYNLLEKILKGVKGASVIDFLPWTQRTRDGARPILLGTVGEDVGPHLEEARSALETHSCQPLEPTGDGGCWQLAALLERSKGGVLMDAGQPSSENAVRLAQTIGFLQACAKPLLVLSESEPPAGMAGAARPGLFSWKRFGRGDGMAIERLLPEWLKNIHSANR